MNHQQEIRRIKTWAYRAETAALLAAIVAMGLMIYAAIRPINTEDEEIMNQAAVRVVSPIDAQRKSIQPLLAAAARRVLVKPAQVHAAVRDSGAAKRLIKRLKLQGVLEVDGAMVAYIHLKDDGLRTVREHDTILEFTVERIDPSGRVSLSLEGVQVELSH